MFFISVNHNLIPGNNFNYLPVNIKIILLYQYLLLILKH